MPDKEPDGALKTAQYAEDARKEVNEKQEGVSGKSGAKPVMAAASDEVNTDAPEDKEHAGHENHADNDGEFHLASLDDGTNVEEGHIMENQAREPAHQQHELAVEEDAPGFEQTAAMMLPRGSPHYDEGGSVAEVKAGREFGEA